MAQHAVVPVRTYLLVFAALLFGTALTVAAAYADLGSLNTPVALGIALTKAVLVVLFFMHVRYGSRLVWLFAGGGFLWLGLLLALTFTDYLSRGWLGQPAVDFLGPVAGG